MSPDFKPNMFSWRAVIRNSQPELGVHKKIGTLIEERGSNGRRVGKREWSNVTWHCLCVGQRARILGEWLGLAPDLVDDMQRAGNLHDYDKEPEIKLHKQRKGQDKPYLGDLIELGKQGSQRLRDEGVSERVVWLASAPGGLPGEITVSYDIVTKPSMTNEEWAFVLIHLADDMALGSKSVVPSRPNESGGKDNVIDDRAAENKRKSYSSQSSVETQQALVNHPFFGGMHAFDAMAAVSHMIEKRFAEELASRTGESLDPVEIPELVDQRLRARITVTSRQEGS